MPSVIEELPFKIWNATKRTSSICYRFLKNWVDKKNREELERQVRQQYINNSYFLSVQIHEILGNKGVKEHFLYQIDPVYEEREVQNGGVKEYRQVQIDEKFYPQFVEEQHFHVSDDFSISFELHRFFLAGRLEHDVLVNLIDRWQARSVGKAVKVGVIQIKNVKYLAFASFVESYRPRVEKYFFENRSYY